jgi:DNA repair ATPase RecN
MNHIRNIEDSGHQIKAIADNNVVDKYRQKNEDIESESEDDGVEITELEDPGDVVEDQTLELENLEDKHVDKLAGNLSKTRDQVMTLLKNAVDQGFTKVDLETGEVSK